jgi:RNA recognition motif-containing protein
MPSSSTCCESPSDSDASEYSESELILPTRMSSADSNKLQLVASELAVHVSGLSQAICETDLITNFSAYGSIQSVKICRDLNGRSLGYGYINFKDKQSVSVAVDSGRCHIQGQDILISETVPREGKDRANIYVRNLGSQIDTQQLRQLFSTFGNVVSCKVLYDSTTGKHLGRGYVEFDTEKNATTAIEFTNGKVLNGTVVQVERYLTKEERQNPHSLYLKGIPSNTNNLDIYKLFSTYGPIKSLYLPINGQDGGKVGWGYINYDNQETANVAQHLLDGHIFEGVHLSVTKTEYQSQVNDQSCSAADDFTTTKVILSKINRFISYQHLEDIIETLVGVYPRNLTLFKDFNDRFVGQALFEARSPMDASQLVYNLHGKLLMGDQIAVEFLGKPLREPGTTTTTINQMQNSSVLHPPPVWLFQGMILDKSKLLMNCILYHPTVNGDPRRARRALELLSRDYGPRGPLHTIDHQDLSRYLYTMRYFLQRL